jgi:uncharacterized protein
MSNPFETLEGQQFINLTTYCKSGEPVVTTVWFAHESDRIVGTTLRHAGKLKRIRANPAVSVAPSTATGQPLGEALKGVARVLPPEDEAVVKTALRNKYGAQFDQITANADPAQRVYWEVRPA